MKRPKHIVVIGAGIGGLSAAIHLAGKGYRVTVLEQLPDVGGKIAEWRAVGFRFDTGPTVITMPHVYERLFREAGRDVKDYLDLVPIEPLTRYHWRDGVVLDAARDVNAMCEQIRLIDPGEVDAYRRFTRYLSDIYDAVGKPFLYRRRPDWLSILSMPLGGIFKIDAFRTMHEAITSFFKDPHLIQLFDRFATYNGSSPYLAPATLNVISHVEMAQGVYYPRGGVYQMALAYERLALDLNVEMYTRSRVDYLFAESESVYAVRYRTHELIHADAVVINADYTESAKKLLPPDARQRLPRQKLEPSSGGFQLMMGINVDKNKLAHHNVFFSSDYRKEFDDIFVRKIPPEDPTLYLCISSKTDSDHAPKGFENWFVMANVPHLTPEYDWTIQGESYAEHLKSVLRSWGLDVGPHRVVISRFKTPLDMQSRVGGNAGSIYGFSSNTRRAAFLRPGNHSSVLRHLYYAGGSVHPGGGLPLVTLSGIAAAESVNEDLR